MNQTTENQSSAREVPAQHMHFSPQEAYAKAEQMREQLLKLNSWQTRAINIGATAVAAAAVTVGLTALTNWAFAPSTPAKVVK